MRSRWSPPAIALVLLMGAGSIVMWLGVPLGLIYAASQLADTSAPSLGPYLLVFVGLPIGMGIMGKLLGVLDRRTRGSRARRTSARSSRPGCAPCAASGNPRAAAACWTP